MANNDETGSATAKSSSEESDADTRVAHELPNIRYATFTTEEYDQAGRTATWKLDRVIMPCLAAMYILNNLDRNNIATAKLAGIEEDLHLSAKDYQTCISILFVGYILVQIPSNLVVVITRSPGVYICLAMIIWGAISAFQTLVKSFFGLAIARFFIGTVEGAFFPGAIYYMSKFYSRKQMGLRIAIFYSSSQLGNAFGGLLAIAILKLDGRMGLEGWRWLFLIEGVVTIGLAIVFAFLLPSSVHQMRALTRVERGWILGNHRSDHGQLDDMYQVTFREGIALTLKDPKTWLLGASLYCIFIAAGVNNFFPSVVATLGYSRAITFALSAPPYILCCIAVMGNGFHSDRKQERYCHIIGPWCIALVANIIAVSTLNPAARYLAMMLMPASIYAGSVVHFSWITSTLSQPVIKRAVSIAFINSICNTPNVWTPFLYNGAPRYSTAFTANLVSVLGAILFATAARMYLERENWKMDNGLNVSRTGPTDAQQTNGYRHML